MNSSKLKSHLGKMPHTSLGFFPTPLHRLDFLSKELGVNLYIKRDDMSGRSLFGGNKIRKLEYLMGDALSTGCEYVFTYGATQSNHAMQTVTACRRCGLKPVLYLVAIVPPSDSDIRSNLLLDKIMGAEIHIIYPEHGETETEAEERSFLLAKEHIKRLEADGHKCYDIPMGGADAVGSIGFIGGFEEMYTELAGKNIIPDYVFHATGTGGTLAGLAAGCKVLNAPTKIISINVSKKDSSYLDMISELANKSLELLSIDERIDAKTDLHTDLSYYAPGYEIPNAASTEAIQLLARTEGIFLDPVYTGKGFAGMLDYIRTGRVPAGSTVVFWHTGGATALFAEADMVGPVCD